MRTVAQPQMTRVLDLRLALDQLVERAIPLLPIPAPPRARAVSGWPCVPLRHATPRSNAGHDDHRQSRSPATAPAHARYRARQAIGDQRQCPLAERDAIAASAPASLRHHMIKTELIPELTYRRTGPRSHAPMAATPARRTARSARASPCSRRASLSRSRCLANDPAAEIDDRVVTGLAAGVAIGFDHAYVRLTPPC